MVGEKKQTVTFNGEEYTFRKLTLGDRRKIRKYIKQDKIKNIDETVDDDSIKKDLIIQTMNNKVSEEELNDFLISEDGVTYLFWNQTDMDKDYDEFLDELSVEEFRDLIDIAVSAIMGDSDAKEPKKKAKK